MASRFIKVVLFSAIAIIVLYSTALASVGDLNDYRDRVEKASTALTDSTAKLKATDPADWTDVVVQEYLSNALWVVFDGLLYHMQKNARLPDSLSALAGTEFIPVWPGNPFAEWAPMEVLVLGDGFKAGCFVLQVCPAEFYSTPNPLHPMSLELAVYGPNEKYADLGNAVPLKYNSWATAPTGALYMVGAFTETAASSRKKFKKMQEQAAKEKAAEDESKQDASDKEGSK